MKINLPIQGFSPYKVALGVLVLCSCYLFPPKMVIYALARAHAIGAWAAMWMAKKLSWRYILWLLFFAATLFSLVFSKTLSIPNLALFGYVMFAVHFIYDEFDLQEQRRDLSGLLAGFSPLALASILLIGDTAHISIPLVTLLWLAFLLIIIELSGLKEINWFFIQTKILTAFIIVSAALGANATFILDAFVISHYFFWFIYPVYKLHKYKRQERDGFVMLLILILIVSLWSPIGGSAGVHPDYIRGSFWIITILHILSTAPFGYLFGLPKPKYSPT